MSNPPSKADIYIHIGTAADYSDHIFAAITAVSVAYSLHSGRSEAEVKLRIIRNLANTMSDRAAVNHKVVQLLMEKLDTSLLEFNCNIHPLEAAARAVQKVIKTIETVC